MWRLSLRTFPSASWWARGTGYGRYGRFEWFQLTGVMQVRIFD